MVEDGGWLHSSGLDGAGTLIWHVTRWWREEPIMQEGEGDGGGWLRGGGLGGASTLIWNVITR